MTATSGVAYLARALKGRWIPRAAAILSKRAREETCDYEAYLATGLSEEVSSRDTHGGQNRVKAALFPQTKTIDYFEFSFQRSAKRATIARLVQLDFIVEASKTWCSWVHPGTGKTHLSIAIGVLAARRVYQVAFTTAHEWVHRFGLATGQGRLNEKLERLRRVTLPTCEDVGTSPSTP